MRQSLGKQFSVMMHSKSAKVKGTEKKFGAKSGGNLIPSTELILEAWFTLRYPE